MALDAGEVFSLGVGEGFGMYFLPQVIVFSRSCSPNP